MSHLVLIWIYLVDLCLIFTVQAALAPIRHGLCNQNLFNESNDQINAKSFKASSVYNEKQEFMPGNARILSPYASHRSGEAWCPKELATSRPKEYIAVDLESLQIVNMIFTTGRGEGNFFEYTPNFIVKYQRDPNQPWILYKSTDGTEILPGNKDERTLSRIKLNPPIIARHFRIYPISQDEEMRVCLRFALYGCPFEDSLLDYSMPQGTKNHGLFGNIDLSDSLYTKKDQRHLFGSLGQLSDNQGVLFNYQLGGKPEKTGSGLVGWNRYDLEDINKLVITFNFENFRNISSFSLFSINNPDQKVPVYSSLSLETSRDGIEFEPYANYQTNDLISDHMPSLRSSEISSALTVNQASIIRPGKEDTDAVILTYPITQDRPLYAKSVRMSLEFAGDWIMLSEVYFKTDEVNEDEIVVQTPPPTIAKKQEKVQSDLDFYSDPEREDAPHIPYQNEPKIIEEKAPFVNPGQPSNTPKAQQTTINGIEDFIANRPSSFFLIGGSILVAFALSLILAFIFHFYCHRRRHAPHGSDDQLNKQGNIINQQSYQTLALSHKDPLLVDQMQFQFNPYLQNNQTLGRNGNILLNNPALAHQLLANSSTNANSFSNSEETQMTTQICNTQLSSGSSKNKEDSISPMSFNHGDDCNQLMNSTNSRYQNSVESEGQDYASTSICGLPQTSLAGGTNISDLQHHQSSSDNLLPNYCANSGTLFNNNGGNSSSPNPNLIQQMYNQQLQLNQRQFLQQTLKRFPNLAMMPQGPYPPSQTQPNNFANPSSGPIGIQQFKAFLDQNQTAPTNPLDLYTNQMSPLYQSPASPVGSNHYPQMTQIKPPEPPLNHPSTSMNSKRNSVYSVCI